MENRTLYGIDDGLSMNEKGVGAWSEDKYALVRLYAQLFTSGMKDKWKSLVFVDLYSGAGQSRIEGTDKILFGSPLIALSIDRPFDKHIFCDRDPQALDALRQRVERLFPTAVAVYIEGDCNTTKDKILAEIPHNALTLCFVDPYDLSIHFSTLQALSTARNIDFLCLLASRTDAGRNHATYTSEESTKVDMFLGSKEWRQAWEDRTVRRKNFGDFVCEQFAKRMETLGYLPSGPGEMRTIKDSNRALYKLALFARHQTAKNYWNQVMKYSIPQRGLFD
jgi:three-Cys-motif partner protein